MSLKRGEKREKESKERISPCGVVPFRFLIVLCPLCVVPVSCLWLSLLSCIQVRNRKCLNKTKELKCLVLGSQSACQLGVTTFSMLSSRAVRVGLCAVSAALFPSGSVAISRSWCGLNCGYTERSSEPPTPVAVNVAEGVRLFSGPNASKPGPGSATHRAAVEQLSDAAIVGRIAAARREADRQAGKAAKQRAPLRSQTANDALNVCGSHVTDRRGNYEVPENTGGNCCVL